LLDHVFGEPRHAHPLVGFGQYAVWLERVLRPERVVPLIARLAGLLALLLAVAPFVALATWVSMRPNGWIADALLLYFSLGARSLMEHARNIAEPLATGDMPAARAALARIVSRDTRALDSSAVAAGAVESVLENGNDAIFAALFWFGVLGGAGALMYRLVNTLDAMWGYRTPRYLHFGWAAARLDDALNFIPARITALCYALLGQCRQALACWRSQAPNWDSPNAGPVMATGAGALGLQLGGPARYHGEWEDRPILGCGARAVAADIPRAMRLVRSTQCVWCALMLLALILKGAYV
jgi:adenosylcobinamide-phosphate synthase